MNNISIRNKILSGFGAINALILLLAVTAHNGVSRVDATFADYREGGQIHRLADEMQLQLSFARLSTMEWRRTQSQETVEEFRRHMAELGHLEEEARLYLTEAGDLNLIREMDQLSNAYLASFMRMIELQEEVTEANETVASIGRPLHRAIVSLMEAAFIQADAVGAFHAGLVMERMLVLRANVEEFLQSPTAEDAARMMAQLERVDEASAQLPDFFANTGLSREAAQIRDDIGQISGAISTLRDAMLEREDVRANGLDSLGVLMAAGYADLEERADRRLEALRVEGLEQVARTEFLVLAISVSCLLLGIVLALLLGHMIARSIATITGSMRDLAAGRTDITISGLGRGDEIGDMARALQVFQEDAREKLRLETARASAEAASQAKSRFLANMSHEIRTPLNGVLGMTQLLVRTQLSEKQADYVETLRRSGHALLALIEDVLDISRIEAGQLVLDNAPYDLAETLEGVRSILLSQAQEKGLALDIQIEPGLTTTRMGDVKRLRQVLINLAGNAVKFTSRGYVTVRVMEAGEARLRFEVEDTGPGIEPAFRENLFERFVQADNSVTRMHEGTGLGLAICKELVNLAGGKIGLENRPGPGSLFWFEIPALLAAISEPESDAGNEDDAYSHETERSRMKILVAEDNRANQSLLEHVLAANGHEAVMAENGVLALEACELQAFDLILMDLHMPRMSGDEVIRRLRSAPGPNQTAPVIVLTADATCEAHKRLENLKISGRLTKPVDLALLMAEIRKAGAAPREASSGQGEAAGSGWMARSRFMK